jgi:hypothetical protein
MPDQPTPSVGRIVHYVSYGTPRGEYTSQCRAAIITAVPDGALPDVTDGEAQEWDSSVEVVDLCVLNPTGVNFNRCAHLEPEDASHITHLGGTWHWPERV